MVLDGGLWTWSSRCPLAVESYGTCWGQRALWLQGYGAQVVLEGHWCPVAHDWRKGPSRVPCGTDEGTRGAIPIPWCPVAQRRGHPNPMVPVCGKTLPASSCWCRTSCTSRHPAVNRALYKLFLHRALSSTTSLYKS